LFFVGIVVSIVWPLYSFHQWDQRTADELQRIYTAAYADCVHTPNYVEDECHKKAWQSRKKMDDAMLTDFVWWRLPDMLFDLVVGWLLAVISFFTLRWIARGFYQKEEIK
jgi:hypothetical protein